jgi:hypothetical protein
LGITMLDGLLDNEETIGLTDEGRAVLSGT